MAPENRDIPNWARQERQVDLEWIRENAEIFHLAATVSFEEAGRGVIVVDTTSEPGAGAGHPFGYFSQEQIEEDLDKDTQRMVDEYNLAQDFVLVLLKPKDRTSTYRVREQRPGTQGSGKR